MISDWSDMRGTSKRAPPAAILLIVVYVVVVVRTAWVMDDAYISFRCVDNAVHGYGLRWNTFERVEAFTNPLWTLVMCAFSLVTRDVFYTGLALQIAMSAVVVYVVARSSPSVPMACGSVAVLCLSKAFVDYSTSGLENPLSHLLVALFAAQYLYEQARSVHSLRRLTLLASLALVNRLDLVWVLGPCVIEKAFAVGKALPRRERNRALLLAIGVGLLPFVAWELFSFFYYGAFIPNSALAKLTSQVPRVTLLWFGASLVRDSLVVDPLTPLCIGAGILFGFVRGSPRFRTMAGGVLLSLAYVMWVGGDHMSGRFLSVPMLASVMLLVGVARNPSPSAIGAAAFAALAAAWMAGFPTLTEQATSLRPAVIDDVEDYQREWHPRTGLLTRGPYQRDPADDWISLGKAAREHPSDVPIWGGIGLAGYYSGPAVRVIDKYGLSDPLLAHLPIPDAKHERYFKTGHFERAIPDGYRETVSSGQNLIRQPTLAHYYDKLALVTQGPLWSWQRLFESVKLNLGAYDSLLAQYVFFEDAKPVRAAALPPAHEKNDGDPMRDCPRWSAPCAPIGVAFTSTGVRVTLDQPSRTELIDVKLTPGRYIAVFWQTDVEVARATFEVVGAARAHVMVEPAARDGGFDSVSFLPIASDAPRLLSYFEIPAPNSAPPSPP